ncbi:P63C domain protein [Pseudomonas aeruginosa]|uniref:P63C domain-containing protein n=1 Tax=Pseudomonas aeruginosa TaxID=287 RepID=UPI00070A04F8|nr:P63C domain-containing protein [Pseudomonas aeruginosa]SOV30168.1 P63C domain protein [Pseudomonas aeruginosa]
MSNNVIQLVHSAGEARVDSRLIAEGLGIKHKYSFALIQKYASRFEELGSLPFQKEARARRAGGGVVERFALLNEDQAYFLLSLSRNSDRVVDLKLRLVKAFRDARNQAGLDNVMGMILLTAPAAWEKRFGDDFYRAMAKITGTTFEGHSKGTPAIFGQLTDRWVYAAILPKEVHAELKARRGESERMHQWLTSGGRDRLDQQIRMVTLIAESSVDRKDFEARCQQAFGLPGQLHIIYPQAA